MEGINDRVAAGLGGGVAGWQKDEGCAVDLFAFQIALEGHAMNLYLFHVDGLGAGLDWRNLRLYLCRRKQRQPERHRQ